MNDLPKTKSNGTASVLLQEVGSPLPGVSLKRTAIRNAAWNWLGVGVEMLVAVLLTPLMIQRLGDSAYGTWIVIGSLTGYLGILDFGLRGSVGRFVAYYHAQNDRGGVLVTLNTAAFVLTGLGGLGFAFAAIAALTMSTWAEVPVDLLPEARLALFVSAVNLGLFFVLRIFDATLWGYQRFDLLNLVDTPAAAARGILSAMVVSQGFGLVGLAWVTLIITLVVGGTKAALSVYVNRTIRLGFRYVRVASFREMWSYGVWNFLSSLATMARSGLSPVIIGAKLGMLWVTPFSIVMRLVGTAGMLVLAGTGVLTPMATALYAQGDRERQKLLLFESGKFCTAVAFYFFSLFIFLGRPLLTLWIGPQLSWAWLPLAIIATGELLPMCVLMAENTVLGMAQNRSLAVRGAGECATALFLAAVLRQRYEFNGVCAGLAIAAAFWRGWFTLAQALALTDTRWIDYIRSRVSVSVLAAIPPMCALGLAVRLVSPDSWLLLTAFAGAFTIVTGVSFAACHFAFGAFVERDAETLRMSLSIDSKLDRSEIV